MKIVFIIWMLLLTVFSVLPDFTSGNIQLTSYKLTSSGFFIHLFSFFIAALLCSKAFKYDRFKFVLISGIIIFLYSLLLEGIQVILPYRTFNYYDILANFVGIALFVIILGIMNKVFVKPNIVN